MSQNESKTDTPKNSWVKDGWLISSTKFRSHYLDGQLHRLDGPAVISTIGSPNEFYEAWYKFGRRHRISGPAVVYNDYREWHFEGQFHREDGPAIERVDTSEYWLRGAKIHASSLEEFQEAVKIWIVTQVLQT